MDYFSCQLCLDNENKKEKFGGPILLMSLMIMFAVSLSLVSIYQILINSHNKGTETANLQGQIQ